MTKPVPEKHGKKTIIGWSEYVDFPDWHIAGMKVKVDTGARSSALHVEDLKETGPGEVTFFVVINQKDERRRKVRAKVLKWAKVRSSTGVYRKRCFVKARVQIGTVQKEIEISLVSREKMLFRMLLGRQALKRDFVVDVSHRAVLGHPTIKKKAVKKK